MDLGQWEVPKREPHLTGQAFFDVLDRAKRLPRVRALVVAVLDDQPAARRASDVVVRRVERLHRGSYSSTRPGSRDVISCSSHVLPSGSLKRAKEP